MGDPCQFSGVICSAFRQFDPFASHPDRIAHQLAGRTLFFVLPQHQVSANGSEDGSFGRYSELENTLKRLSRRSILLASGALAAGAGATAYLRRKRDPYVQADPFGSVVENGLNFAKTMDGGYERPFSGEEYDQRLQRTREMMAKQGIDLLYVTSPEGMCYYTGYQATWYWAQSTTKWPAMAALAIHVDYDKFVFYDTDEEYLVHKATSSTDDRHWLPEEAVYDAEAGASYIVNDLSKRGWAKGRVGMELWSHVPNPYISNLLQMAFAAAGGEVVDGTRVIRGVRNVKSPQEIAYIEAATEIVDIGHRAMAEAVYSGVTQAELHGVAYAAMLKAGGELPGINQGVVSGPLGSAHALSSRRPIQKGEAFIADFSGVVNRYHSNVCRTYVFGEPSRETLRMSDASRHGVEHFCSLAKAGTSIAEVSRQMREFFIEKGVWEFRQYIGGYEQGIAFPPDWVGEWMFDISLEEDQGVFETNTVSNFESVFANLGLGALTGVSNPDAGVNIETVVYGPDGARPLSEIDMVPIVVG